MLGPVRHLRLPLIVANWALGWIEEPLLSEHNDLLAAIVGNTATPLATGERFYNRWVSNPSSNPASLILCSRTLH
jgi:hypothetical protein